MIYICHTMAKATKSVETETILKILWAISKESNDKFYFMTYGEDILERLVRDRIIADKHKAKEKIG